MTLQNDMPLGGARELRKFADGRKYLASLQKKYALDILQPGSVKFDQVYGEKLRKQEETRHKISEESKAMWEEKREKKGHDEFKKNHVNPRYL